MANQVILIITEGPHQGKRFTFEDTFEEAKVVRFGRASDCDVRFEDDRRMSRYHCELEIDPPQAQIYDLGSLHGTLVNGAKYGGRTERKVKKGLSKRQHPPVELQDGDEIQVGQNVIRVEIKLDKTFILATEDDAPTLFEEELDETIIIDKRSVAQTSPDAKPRSHQGPAKTVVEPSVAQQPYAHDAKTVIDASAARQPYAHDAKTVIDASAVQQPYAHDAKTVIDASAVQQPYAHDAKTVVDASARRPSSHYQSKTVVGSPVRQPAHNRDKTIVERAPNSLPAHNRDKTIVERAPRSLPAHDLDKTIVERAPSSLPAHDPDKTVVEPSSALSQAHDPDKTVVAATQPQTRPAKALEKTVAAHSSNKKSAAAQPSTPAPAPARFVLRPDQQTARSALLELLKDLGLKALNQDPNLAAYVIERRLGQGGFGKVFQARHRTTEERVAIKIMRPRAAVNEYVRKSFKREIDNTRRLFHPNIVQLLEDGSVGNMFYFMMEFCDGGNANQLRRKRGGKIPLAEALPIMKQILQGLSFIHERGYIHRDLKPDNILLTNTPNGTVAKIADLGLTKGFLETGLNGGLTITGVRIGTGPYMSREQLTNFKYVEPVSDVWSIGATFYVMLTGQRPRQGPPNLKNYDLVLKGRIIPIRNFDRSIPFTIANIIDRALVVDIKKRYETATEMLHALERVR